MIIQNSTTEGLHVHGGSPDRDMKRLGIKPEKVIDLSVSISPFGPPVEIQKAWPQMIDEIAGYPDIEGQGIINFFNKKYGIPRDSLIAGNGSTELIYLIPRVLGLKKAVVVVPSFSDYRRAAKIAGTQIVPLYLSAHNGFSPPSYEEFARTLTKSDALIIGNPNNPTGTIYSRELILELARNFPHVWIIIDEAFIQFIEHQEEVSLINFIDEPNIIVIHSLTKFYALAGLRMGCAAACKDVITRLRAYKEPWTVNGIAERAASILLQCQRYEKRLKDFITKERMRLLDKLSGLKGLRVFNSSTNFCLNQWTKTDNLDDLLRCLLKEGFYVRDCRNFPGLKENFFRFAIGSEQDNNRLIQVLCECLK